MNVRQVRNKIKSVGNVKKITKAMQMISAIKMKKAQSLAVESKPYREMLTEMINKITKKIDISYSDLLTTKEGAVAKSLIIAVSSNKGLAGTYHTNLARFILKNVDIKNSEFIVIGKKGATFISSIGGKVIAEFVSSKPITDVSAVFELALDNFLTAKCSRVAIIYNKFISTLRSETVEEQLLPFTMNGGLREEADRNNVIDYHIEPSAAEIIEPLLQSYIEEKIRGAVVNSEAVEHSSRMIAMKNATDNANDVIYNLTLLGNKLRQGRITGELLDMVTAKESVEN